jgi:PIN domain nuclease of toxin-antitoxin system
MNVGVADTHTALWHLFGDVKFSRPAEDFIQAAAASRHKVAVSAISVAELIYLVEKNRLPLSAYDDLLRALNNPARSPRCRTSEEMPMVPAYAAG